MNLLIITLILLLALIAIRISDVSGMPSLLLFLILGIVFKALGFSTDFDFAEKFAIIALLIIMFYGGFGTNWQMGKPVVKEAVSLASLGVVATALLTGAFAYFFLKTSLIESMLLGSVVASTDYASVSNILTSKNLNLKYNTAPMLEIESGSNDPTAYTMTMIFLSILLGSDLLIPVLVIKQVLFGILIGFVSGYVMKKIVRNINLNKDGLFIIFMLAISLLVYSFTDLIDGNGYLAVYIFGIYIGNQEYMGKRDVVFFFDGFAEILQIGLFFILGLLSEPSNIIKTLPVAFLIMVFMTLIARPLSVFVLLKFFKAKSEQILAVSFAGLRGAAAISFAIMAINSGANLTIDLYHIVFGICFLSALIQGSLMPFVIKKLDMLDPNDTVLKNFNYYQDKSDIGFLRTNVKKGTGLDGSYVRDLNLAFDFIVAKIIRDKKTIVPRGDIKLKAGDTIVLGGENYFDSLGSNLTETTLSNDHPWANNKIMHLNIPKNILILMLQKEDGSIVVPDGSTFLIPGDKVVYIKEDEKIFIEYEKNKRNNIDS